MEIIKLASSGIKIKAKSATFIIDPSDGKTDEEVVVLFEKPQDYSRFEGKLVIDGPGEYEVGGVSIRVERVHGSLSFDFFEEGQKIVIISDPEITGDVETEDSKVVLVRLSQKLGDKAISSIQSEVVSFYGPEEFLPQEKGALKRTDKINLKKTEELKGYLVYLTR